MATFNKVIIKEITQETANAVSVLFDIPPHLQTEFNFTAGQYITLQKQIKGTFVRRAYSICSTPQSGTIRVAIKAVENGIFSQYATSQMKVGDEIEISVPEGRFLLNPEANKNYIGFAAGSGITPILSMVETVLEKEPTATFTLVYGNKSEVNTIFYKKLNDLKKSFSERFNLHYIFSEEEVKNELRGRIDENVTSYFVKNRYKEISFDEAFLCGPEEMIQKVSKTLENNKIAKEHIHFELFTAAVDKEATSEIKAGTSEVTVLLDDEEATFTMQQKDTILAASLRNNLDAPYSCQGGVCSSCMGKVTEGKAIMVKNSILTDSEVEEGLVLACQAYPTTPKITIDFDDV